jgi:O-antigen/teichoic acid export membrane protein
MIRRAIQQLRDRLPSGARDAGVVFSGDVSSKFLTFLITLSMLAMLTPEEYLLYGLFITVLAAVNQFTDSGLHQSFIRFYALYNVDHPDRAQAYFQFTLKVKILITLLAAAALYVFAGTLAEDVLRAPAIEAPLRIMTIAVIGGGLMEYVLSVLQARQAFVRFTAIRLAEALLKTGFIYAAIVFGAFSLDVVYLSYAAAPLLVGFAAVYFVTSMRGRVEYDWRDIGSELFRFAKWLMITSFATMFLMRLDVFMVTPLLSDMPDEAGLYIAATKLCTPLIVLAGSVSTVFFPKAMELRSTNDMRRYLSRTLAVSLPVTGLGLLYMLALYLMIPQWFPAYEPSLPLFTVLFIGYAWTIVGNPVTMLILSINRARAATWIALAQLVATTASHYYFITTMGAMGAAVSSVLVWFAAGTVTMWYIWVHRSEIEHVRAERVS